MQNVDLVEMMRKKGYIKSQSAKFIRDLCDTIAELLSNGESVRLINVGTFDVIRRDPKRGYNYLTGQVDLHPAYHVIKFRPTHELKLRVRNNMRMLEGMSEDDKLCQKLLGFDTNINEESVGSEENTESAE